MKNIIIVTGASSGMGRSFAKQIVKKISADEIWVIARRKERLDELQNEIDIKVVPIAIDVSKSEEIEIFHKKLEDEKPNIILLACCAGWGRFSHYENVSYLDNQNMIDVNIKSTVYFVDYSLPYMRENSKIMIIASNSSYQPVPYINMYASTKAFVLSYARSLNKELKYRKIHVLAVTPLWIKTEFFNRAIDENENPVVIKYNGVYEPDIIMKRAIHDLFKNKEISAYGFINRFQIVITKILPHKLVQKIWMKQQKLDGTKEIKRKNSYKHHNYE